MAKKFDVSAIVRKHAEIKSASVGGNFVQLQTNVDNPVTLNVPSVCIFELITVAP